MPTQSKLEKITRYLAQHEETLIEALDLLEIELQCDDIEIAPLEELRDEVTNHWEHYGATQANCQEEGGDRRELYAELRKRYFTLKKATTKTLTKERAKLAPPATPQPPTTSNPPATSVRNKLKPLHLELPKFSGERSEWPVFWQIFESQVHNNKELTDLDKFGYLKQSLTCEAATRLRGFSGIGKEYEQAVAILLKAYVDAQALKHELLDEFYDIPAPSCNPASLTTFQISFSGVLRQLKSNNADTDGAEWALQYHLQRKLPQKFKNFLYNRYQINWFTLEQMYDGISHYALTNGGEDCHVDRDKRVARADMRSKSISTPGAMVAAVTYKGCMFCFKDHPTKTCTTYGTVESRRRRLQDLEKCRRCVRPYHGEICEYKLDECEYCGRTNHHMYFCYKEFPSEHKVGNRPSKRPPAKKNASSKPQGETSKAQPSKSNSESGSSRQPSKQTKSSSSKTTHVQHNSCRQSDKDLSPHFLRSSTALPTAKVTVRGSNKSRTVRAFFDQGAQKSFIMTSLKQYLKLSPIDHCNMSICTGFDYRGPEKEYNIVQVHVTLGGRTKILYMVVVDKLPTSIHSPGLVEAANYLKRKQIPLADVYENDNVSDVNLLIGSDHYYDFIDGMTNKAGINLLKTPAGHIISGPVLSHQWSSEYNCSQFTLSRITVSANPAVHKLEEITDACVPVHKLWDLDTIGICADAPYTQDQLAYEQYLSTIRRVDNQYFVRLPWKRNHKPLPNNFRMALGQLHGMLRGLRDNSKKIGLIDQYDKVIKDQLQAQFIEEVDSPKVTENTHYIPHHAVLKDSATTPVRIVYNCSAKSGKDVPSLNDTLLSGPSMTQKLSDILLQFRINSFAFSADISKAFLRIGLQEQDRDFTRFLWLENPRDPQSKLVTYRFASVLFGATSSPFLLQATLDYHLNQSDSPHKDILSKGFYVDNLQGTTESIEDLVSIYRTANELLKGANMPLRDWATNAPHLKTIIQGDNVGTDSSTIKLLGLIWDTVGDKLKLQPVKFSPSVVITKRSLLAAVSTVFDPLGFFTPITIVGRQLLQDAWRIQSNWDQPLPSEIVSKWSNLSEDLRKLSTLQLPRKVCTVNNSVRLVIFTDASSKAYGAVAYIVTQEDSHLLTSKARVCPLQGRTLPQLELTGVQVGAQLAGYVADTLVGVQISGIFLFSDSEVSLQWIRNGASTIDYVKNRVDKIQELARKYQIILYHVPTKENPADILSRGVSFSHYQQKWESFWLHGPEWLTSKNSWPIQRSHIVVSEITTDVIEPQPIFVPLFDPEKYSSFHTLIKVTRTIFTAAQRFKLFIHRESDFEEPEVYWLKYAQVTQFPQVCDILRKDNKHASELRRPSHDLIRDLGLYMDPSNSLIKSRTRLRHSVSNSESTILLPPKSYITKLIILKAHESVSHGGMSETLSEIRKQFWLPKGRQKVKTIISSCLHCRRLNAKPFTSPGPPPLPEERVNYELPFESVGVDFTGAITIKDGATGALTKVYVCLFTCTATRSVHLELAKDLSASTFIILFRRFCARFSIPKLIISDNGTNFTASAAYFHSLFSDLQVKDHLNEFKIRWKFIAPRAPWQGGFYERLIRVVKGCLKKVMYRRMLDWDELVTVLLEIEQCINNRPLTYVESELADLQPLTPNHLLLGRPTQIMPSVVTEDVDDPMYCDHQSLNNSYSKLSKLLSHFKQVWEKDYLPALKEKHYGNQLPSQPTNLKPGDIVLVSSESPRINWPLGRITQVFQDTDGIIRTVEVLFNNHKNLRTIEKLYPLELQSHLVDQPEMSDNNIDDTTEPETVPNDHPVDTPSAPTRPSRVAAQKAVRDRRQLIDLDML